MNFSTFGAPQDPMALG